MKKEVVKAAIRAAMSGAAFIAVLLVWLCMR